MPFWQICFWLSSVSLSWSDLARLGESWVPSVRLILPGPRLLSGQLSVSRLSRPHFFYFLSLPRRSSALICDQDSATRR